MQTVQGEATYSFQCRECDTPPMASKYKPPQPQKGSSGGGCGTFEFECGCTKNAKNGKARRSVNNAKNVTLNNEPINVLDLKKIHQKDLC
jgi:hypothetical protein